MDTIATFCFHKPLSWFLVQFSSNNKRMFNHHVHLKRSQNLSKTFRNLMYNKKIELDLNLSFDTPYSYGIGAFCRFDL